MSTDDTTAVAVDDTRSRADGRAGHDGRGAQDDSSRRPRSRVATSGARVAALLRRCARWVVPLVGAVALYAGFLVVQGADPVTVLRAMFASSLGSTNAIGETLVRATPLLLAALAVAIPARAGLFNIGGEGQLLIGAVGGLLVSRLLDGALPAAPTLVLVGAGGAIGGMLWAAIPALLKVTTNTSEAIATLLSNYLAALLLTWLVFSPWRDPSSLGQAYSAPVTHRLPILWGNRVHAGILVAVLAAVAVWAVRRYSSWGFQLRVVGGNPEAARRAGLRVGELQLTALIAGGMLAGIGGAVELAGIEGRLRPDMLVGFGFIGFLASWMARHHPLKAVGAAIALGAVYVGGSGLRLASGLSGSAVNVLMAVLLLAVLGWGPTRAARR